MMDIIAMLIIVFLAVAGVFAFVRVLKRSIDTDKDDCFYVLIPADENSDALEMDMKRAKRLLRDGGGRAQKNIIVLDNGMSEWMKEIVDKEREGKENIFLMRANELQNLR